MCTFYVHTLTLSDGKRVAIFDARNRLGGRLLTASGGGDLGGAWIWQRHEYVMNQFINEIDVNTVPMYMDGETQVRTHDGKRHTLPPGAGVQYAACGGGAVRIPTGAASMVEKLLLAGDDNLSIHLGTKVVRVEHNSEKGGVVTVISKPESDKDDAKDDEEVSIQCNACIIAAPPKIVATTIDFLPPLPKNKIDSMLATPTWMEDYGKVSVSFPRNWWRESNLSAISIDQMGAVQTWWEACSGIDDDGTFPTLAGFVTAQGATILQSMESDEALHDYIIDSLEKVYGIDSARMKQGMQECDISETTTVHGSASKSGVVVSKGGITVTYKSWLEDPYTKCTTGEIDFTTDYGARQLQQSIGPLFFAGTETAHGSGHMEGAVVAANRATEEVLKYLA